MTCWIWCSATLNLLSTSHDTLPLRSFSCQVSWAMLTATNQQCSCSKQEQHAFQKIITSKLMGLMNFLQAKLKLRMKRKEFQDCMFLSYSTTLSSGCSQLAQLLLIMLRTKCCIFLRMHSGGGWREGKGRCCYYNQRVGWCSHERCREQDCS